MTATPERRSKCIRFEAEDGTVIRLSITSTVDLTMSNGEKYLAGGFPADTGIVNSVSGGATSFDLGLIDSLDDMSRSDVDSGRWDNAKVFLFATDWAYPVEDEEEIGAYTLGVVTNASGMVTIQMMGLMDKLNQASSRSHTASCLWTFADTHLDTGLIASDKSRCKIDPAPYTFTGSLTSVDDSGKFTDSGRLEADDYFGNGEIIFTTGENSTLGRQNIKSFSAGTFELAAPFYFMPKVGDQYTVIAGCRKRGPEDCTARFGNRKRFGGFSYVPTRSQVSRFGSQ